VCFLARSFGLGRRAAGLASVLSLLVSNPFGVGLRGLFETGLVPHQVGAVFFCLALGAAVRTIAERRKRWIVLLAASLAALAVTHLISLLILGVMLLLTLGGLAATRRLSRSGVRRLLVGCAGGAGLCGFWLVPFLVHRDLQGVVATWGPPPLLRRLGDIASGDILLPAGLAFVVVAAWAYQVVRVRRGGDPAALLWVVTPVAYLLVAHGLPHLVGTNEATLQLANRGLGYAGLLAMFALAALVADGCRRWGGTGQVVALALTAATALVWAPGRDSAGQFPEPIPALPAAARELSRLVPEGARFATQRDFPTEVTRTGIVHPETWLAHASGRNSLNGFNFESSSTPRAATLMERLDDTSANRTALRLARYGVTHVVATSEEFAHRLTRSSRFRPVWSSPPLTILALDPAPGTPPPASQVTAAGPVSTRLTHAGVEHLSFDMDAPQGVAVTLALAWSPKWHGRINGAPVRLARENDGLVGLTVPAGRSVLRLDYRGDAWDRLGVASTLVTVAAGGVSIVGTERRRRRCAGSGWTDPPSDSTTNPASTNGRSARTLRPSRTTFPRIRARSSLTSSSANSGHSVTRTTASTPSAAS
jgi:hypothetical protein